MWVCVKDGGKEYREGEIAPFKILIALMEFESEESVKVTQ